MHLRDVDNTDLFDQLIENQKSNSEACTDKADAEYYNAIVSLLEATKKLYLNGPAV